MPQKILVIDDEKRIRTYVADQLHPGAGAVPMACCGVSERLESIIITLRIEDSPQRLD